MLDRAQLDTELKSAHQANFVRYAIYYTPQPGTPLAAFGRSWFGRGGVFHGQSLRRDAV